MLRFSLCCTKSSHTSKQPCRKTFADDASMHPIAFPICWRWRAAKRCLSKAMALHCCISECHAANTKRPRASSDDCTKDVTDLVTASRWYAAMLRFSLCCTKASHNSKQPCRKTFADDASMHPIALPICWLWRAANRCLSKAMALHCCVDDIHAASATRSNAWSDDCINAPTDLVTLSRWSAVRRCCCTCCAQSSKQLCRSVRSDD
mmetsp:Transcript_167928/g.534024  ORF Transcript_167928/g.534024 Transcript_167928/m.534024 type:complete len:206 (-) Transcript_167928:1754-2371(-)